jgi:hypothetical protein
MTRIADVHRELNEFYDDWVCIGDAQRESLERARDACLDRLSRGLERLGEQRRQKYRSFESYTEQGSFAMGTLNRHPRGRSDIDVAVVFRAEDLPTTALAARQRIADAFQLGGGNFVRAAEPRTNAVTVWYANKSHLDFAVYREKRGLFGSTVEHAGPDWTTLDPHAVAEWFKSKTKELSPEAFTSVRSDQFRRVVQWVKAFARSRQGWDLPGGMILSALLAETYELDRRRDDVALFATLKATLHRLHRSLEVWNPVDRSQNLVAKPQRTAQLKEFAVLLDAHFERLKIISDANCTRREALLAWGTFFNDEFWRMAAEASLGS